MEDAVDAGFSGLSNDELAARITELAGHLNAANHRWLVLTARSGQFSRFSAAPWARNDSARTPSASARGAESDVGRCRSNGDVFAETCSGGAAMKAG